MSNNLIFGLTWEQIQLAQQGKPFHPLIHSIDPKGCTQTDLNLLQKHGVKELRKMEYFGVLDRLTQSKIIE